MLKRKFIWCPHSTKVARSCVKEHLFTKDLAFDDLYMIFDIVEDKCCFHSVFLSVLRFTACHLLLFDLAVLAASVLNR
jgi:hypothetical protein